MAYDRENIKNEVNNILPENSRLRVTAHHDANSAIIDYLFIPFGIALPFFGNTIPDNCNLCDGSKFKQADYPYLYEAIGDIYNTNAALDEFNIPLIPAGASLIQTGMMTSEYTEGPLHEIQLGETGGLGEVKLTGYQSGVAAHTHEVLRRLDNGGTGCRTTQGVDVSCSEPFVEAGNMKIKDSDYTDADYQNAGQSHENMPPYIACNWIIRLK